MWNIAAAIIGLNNVNVDYFQWKSNKANSKGPSGIIKDSALDIAIRMVSWEGEHGPLPEATVNNVPLLATWLSKRENSSLLDKRMGHLQGRSFMACRLKVVLLSPLKSGGRVRVPRKCIRCG
jgi:hypothetical protein